jgi:hypothetical protein
VSRPEIDKALAAGKVVIGHVTSEGEVTVVAHEIPEWNKAIMAYLIGDHTKLTAYLQNTTRPLSLYKQAELAWALDERARPKKRTQSLKQQVLIGKATKAQHFFEKWREENAARGINDYGHRAAMREQACKFVVELDGRGDAAAIEALLNRSTSRRTLG